MLAAPVAYALRTSPGPMLDRLPFPDWILGAALLMSPFVAGWAMRRWLLVRGAQLSMASRGVCGKCKTALMGRPVSAEGKVACAGCDRVHDAEAAWDEVVLREGEPVFRPTTRWHKPSAWSTWVAPLAVLMALTVLPALTAVVVFEYTVARDARAARADRTGYAPMAALAGTMQPSGSSPGDANAWERIEAAMKLKEKADAAWESAEVRESLGRRWAPPEFMDYGEAYSGQSGYEGEEQFKAAVALAGDMIPHYRKEGVFAELDAVAAQPRTELVWGGDPRMPVVSVHFPQLKMVRDAAKVNRVRVRLAAEAGDVREFEAALTTQAALAEACAPNPGVLPGLVSIAVETYSFREIRKLLYSRPAKEWVDACERALTPRRARPPVSFWYEGEKASVLDAMAYAFSQPAVIRSRAYEGLVGDERGKHPRVGFYADNRRIAGEAMDRLIAASRVERTKRPKLKMDGEGLYFAGILVSAFDRSLTSLDQIALDRDGVAVMIALERYRLEHGGYPERLEELVPAQLKAVPIDTWSGRPLRYRRGGVDGAANDPRGWGYCLWSVGGDGFDNGGHMMEQRDDRYRPLTSDKFSGFDFILNDRER